VDRVEFVQLRAGTAAALPPASGAALSAAASKLRGRLASSAMFTQVEVEVTADPDRLLVGMARYRPGTSERQVSSVLEAVWVTELRLPGLDAFHFTTDDRYVELESVTGDHQSGYFLTLNLIAVEGTPEDFEGHEPAQSAPALGGPRTKRRFWRSSSTVRDDDR
jgi:hypothetical protein